MKEAVDKQIADAEGRRCLSANKYLAGSFWEWEGENIRNLVFVFCADRYVAHFWGRQKGKG